jgi:hypothetical protein
LVNFKHIVVVNDLDENVIANIIGSFGIKYVYVNVKKNTHHIISAATQCGAKIYGFDRNDAILYDRNDEVKSVGFIAKSFLICFIYSFYLSYKATIFTSNVISSCS